MATSRSWKASWARKTSLVAPSPSLARTLYLPICAGRSLAGRAGGGFEQRFGGHRWRAAGMQAAWPHAPQVSACHTHVAGCAARRSGEQAGKAPPVRHCAAARAPTGRRPKVESADDPSQARAARGAARGAAQMAPEAGAARRRSNRPSRPRTATWRSPRPCRWRAREEEPARAGAGPGRRAAAQRRGAALGAGAGDRRAGLHQPAPDRRRQAGRGRRSAARRRAFGRQPPNGQRVLVEFVSANPTGPLHVGHARQAALGDAICNLFETQGWQVHARVLLQRRRRADRHAGALGAGAPAGPEARRRRLARRRLQRRVHRRHRRRLPGQARRSRRRPRVHRLRRHRTTSTASASSRWPTCATSRTWTCGPSACASTTTSSSRACTPAAASRPRCSAWWPPARPTRRTARCGCAPPTTATTRTA